MHRIVAEDLKSIALGIQRESGKLQGKTLLISGGSGFLGSYLIGTIQFLNKNVLPKPCRVLSLDNFITGSRKSMTGVETDKNIKRIEADIRDPLNVDEPIDFVIHAAGLASPVYYQKFPLETIEATVTGAKNLLELARQTKNLKSFLFFSSSEIYGDPHPNFIPMPETYNGNVSCTGPRACYDESKRLTETICMIYHKIYNIPVKIVRPFNIYGPGMKTNDHRVIPSFITKGLASTPIEVYNRGNQTRTFCYITDAVIGFFKVLLSKKSGETYNVGVGKDSEEISMFALANIIAELSPRRVAVKSVEYPETYPAGEPNRRRPDITKISKALDYHPVIDLKTGLLRTMTWFRDTLPPHSASV